MPQPPSQKTLPQKIPQQRILVVISTLHTGGAERVVSRLSLAWAKQHQVTVALFDVSHPAYAVGGSVHDLKAAATRNPILRLMRPIQRVTRLTRLIRQRQFTHIISFMEDSNFPVIAAASITGTLAKTSVSTRVDPNYLAWFQRLLLRFLYHLPSRVVTLSQAVKDILQSWGLPEKRVVFIPNPTPPIPNKSLPRPKFPQSKTKAKYILAVGRLTKQKGFDLLLPAYAGLAKTAPPLVILGDGEDRQALTRLAKKLDISDRVHFMGAVANPENYYAHAECFVLSSRWEGWGNVIMEAMAHACPVVSFDCPVGPDEIITHGKNGVLVADGDIQGLTAAIAKMLGDAKLRQRLGKAGQARAKEFNITNLAPLWLKK